MLRNIVIPNKMLPLLIMVYMIQKQKIETMFKKVLEYKFFIGDYIDCLRTIYFDRNHQDTSSFCALSLLFEDVSRLRKEMRQYIRAIGSKG